MNVQFPLWDQAVFGVKSLKFFRTDILYIYIYIKYIYFIYIFYILYIYIYKPNRNLESSWIYHNNIVKLRKRLKRDCVNLTRFKILQ